MSTPIIEEYRRLVVGSLFERDAFVASWERLYLPEIVRVLGKTPTAENVLELGRNLYRVFRQSHKAEHSEVSRDQSSLASAGEAWERLVCWYLNLGLVGSRAVIVKRRSDVPRQIQDALAVTIQDRATNSESDLVAVGLGFLGEPPVLADTFSLKTLVSQLETALSKTSTTVGVIQCKTGWNDNAQAPMLWNAVYLEAFSGASVAGLNLGRNGHKLGDFGRFFYSFVTVPSQPVSRFSNTSLAVVRLASLSGKRFWAWRSEPGIARNISEMFRDGATFGPMTEAWDSRLTAALAAGPRPEFRIPGWR